MGLRPERPVLFLQAPAGPANLTGTIATSPASVSLTWTNHATTPAATQVWIQRATNAGFTSNVTDIPVGAAAASYTDATVVAGTTYYYRVLAQNRAGNSPWSNVASILYAPLPAAPSALAATLAGSSVSLTWTNHATTPAATQVLIQRATNAGFTSNVTSILVGAAVASYTDATVVAGTTYYYRVLAQGLAGNSPWSNVASILYTPLPAAPSALAATLAGSSVSLTWTNHATTPAATQVLIQRATNAGFTSNVTSILVGAAVASYTDATVVAGTTYYYRVLAQGLAGNSPWSNVVSILYTPLPAAPSALAATLAGSSVSLTWTNHATTPAATQVLIQRATNAGFTSNVTSILVGAAVASYTDPTVVAGTTYYYRVLAQGLAGNSPWSNIVSFLHPSASAPASFFGSQFACAPSCAGSFGWSEDTSVITADSVPAGAPFTKMLRVTYPQGSIDSGSVATLGTPLGGAQAAMPFSTGATSATTTLQYYVRPQPGFEPNKGGKLPGLYGGDTSVASGGNDPNGTNGWSARLMWRNDDNGEVYAYMDTTDGYGTQLGCGNWVWQPGKWTEVQETVSLNTPGESNGYIIVYINGVEVLDATGLEFRTVSSLQINGLFFSTFFGGSDKTWASPQTQHTDFADFAVTNQPVASSMPTVACTVLPAYPSGPPQPGRAGISGAAIHLPDQIRVPPQVRKTRMPPVRLQDHSPLYGSTAKRARRDSS